MENPTPIKHSIPLRIMFQCGECGHFCFLVGGQARTFRSRMCGNNDLPIPDDLLIPVCEGCGEDYWNQDITDVISAIEHAAYEKYRMFI
jgi:hypothetical protein